ncbi:carboxymuconolactone decarboxylase family protein [Novosphingobium sp. B 225]|uniref:carboxymuconolactone decarboxylase family protein n=1 Tax=Novosphingobium sp. B 225 TaxID=1961849 RepID=UPI000B4AB73F|nr:carboxymuconolactone decarboxylase family protein [Novosphingobium sp. B 225]
MRLPAPRIAPLHDAELGPEAQAALAGLPEFARAFNIFRTQAHKPAALKAFLAWGNYVLGPGNSLDPRMRELAILRTGYLCRAGYEWAQHVVIGQQAGLTPDEVAAIKRGAQAPGWSTIDRAVLTACDELVRGHFITDPTWAALTPLGDEGRIDLVYTVGQYTQVSMLLNSAGVQLDAMLTVDPDLMG